MRHNKDVSFRNKLELLRSMANFLKSHARHLDSDKKGVGLGNKLDEPLLRIATGITATHATWVMHGKAHKYYVFNLDFQKHGLYNDKECMKLLEQLRFLMNSSL